MEKTKIDWCDSTWNPVTGCLHGCEYCYARGIAERFGAGWEHLNEKTRHELCVPARGIRSGKRKAEIIPYPYGFQPTFHRYRLEDYIEKKGRNIFVCSMADLFGDWVPDSWIEEVFAACEKAPQHRYLFLTKNPGRYIELAEKGRLPERENMWYGITVTDTRQMRIAELIIQDMLPGAHAFLSIEPIIEDISKDSEIVIANFTDWVIIGAETGRRKEKVVPKREWIGRLVEQCDKYRIPVFMKSNLESIWGEPLIQEFPEGLEERNDNN